MGNFDKDNLDQIFDKNDWDHLHDAILDATWNTTKKNCDRAELVSIYYELPEMLRAEAVAYGMSDSPFRDNVIKWWKENKQ